MEIARRPATEILTGLSVGRVVGFRLLKPKLTEAAATNEAPDATSMEQATQLAPADLEPPALPDVLDTNTYPVELAHFAGGNDPDRWLKTALKADIDVDAWDSRYQTASRPFPKPETHKVAVKVINDYGDAVMKVFEVS